MQDINEKKPNAPVNTDAKTLYKANNIISDMDGLHMKIDKILKYQKQVRALAIVRAIFSFAFFFIFIILPIVGGFYLLRFVQENVNLDQVRDQYTEFQDTINDIKSTKDKVNNFKDSIGESGEKIKGLLPGGSD